MMARIGVMRALNRDVVREFGASRKDTHWEKRKLKRDEQPLAGCTLPRNISDPSVFRSTA
jgi:hypothetical protein